MHKLRGSDENGKDDEGDGRGTTENPNCCTKLSRNQVPGNPRAFKYFGTIAKANYVADVRTGAALKRLSNGANTRAWKVHSGGARNYSIRANSNYATARYQNR